MPNRRGRLLPVLVSALLLVGAANLGAYAATGGPLLLGKSNTASKTTKLKTTGDGVTLSLQSDRGSPSLAVSSPAKVKRLNADRLDGFSSASLRNRAFVYNLTATAISDTSVAFVLAGDPHKYLVSFTVTASITGSATTFGCSIVSSGGAPSGAVSALGQDIGGGNWVVSGSGYSDASFPNAHRLVCTRSGGTSMTIPSSSQPSAQVVLTKLDTVEVQTSAAIAQSTP
jgi:hypothetical protein